ncbi:unnamed protein product [Paramecium sonneborni]|uniref:Transmembrane protein n=1 Tax=Paramecium sonneborni TaxID=65129 RepID=A0A8S1K9V9_9CILI|nr:unnamed protein product [Paramecium sonneborni]
MYITEQVNPIINFYFILKKINVSFIVCIQKIVYKIYQRYISKRINKNKLNKYEQKIIRYKIIVKIGIHKQIRADIKLKMQRVDIQLKYKNEMIIKERGQKYRN